MVDELKIEVKGESRDRYSRITETKIGRKVVSTPNFCIQLQDSDELDLFIKLREQYPSDRLTTSVVRFVDMRQALWRLHPKVPKDVLMQVRKDKYSFFFEHQVLLKDLMFKDEPTLFINALIKTIQKRHKFADSITGRFSSTVCFFDLEKAVETVLSRKISEQIEGEKLIIEKETR